MQLTEFAADPLVGAFADQHVAGLNIAVAWPLPESMRDAYLDLAARVAALDPELYVYPYETTHVTLLTAVNFKRHCDPSSETIRTVDNAAAALGLFVAEATRDLGPFVLEVGRPALAEAAAFFPMRNAGGEIAALRERALAFCRAEGGILSDATAPRTIHSTFVRFRQPPRHPLTFASEFESTAKTSRVDRIEVDEILVTFETKPYMRAGRRAHSIPLRRRP
jgi:hypothetical protein